MRCVEVCGWRCHWIPLGLNCLDIWLLSGLRAAWTPAKRFGRYKAARGICIQYNSLRGVILVHVPVSVFGASVATSGRLEMHRWNILAVNEFGLPRKPHYEFQVEADGALEAIQEAERVLKEEPEKSDWLIKSIWRINNATG